MNSIRKMTYAILLAMFFLIIIIEFIARSMPIYITNPYYPSLFFTTCIGLLILISGEKEEAKNGI